MKKIGIITVSRTTNFGAELQAFALQHKLNQLGYDAEVIDYLYFKNRRHKPTNKSRPELTFSRKVKLKSYLLYHVLAPFVESIFPLLHAKTKQKKNNFKLFHKSNIRFSKEFRTADELYAHEHPYDVIISGSDQVWNPATFSSLRPYLLDFVPNNILRMSYAASFGVSEVSREYGEIYKVLFEKFHYIGVREEAGRKLVHEIAKRNAEVVLDPTLLLSKEEWKYVTKNVVMQITKPYILVYDLHPSGPLLKVVSQLQDELDMPTYRLCKRSFKNPNNENIINIEDAGPSEFIYLFTNASFVVTNSFHGTAFSVNFNVPFYSVLKPGKGNNSRITDFLDFLGLANRIVWEGDEGNLKISKLEFEDANEKLAGKKLSSIKFLENTISSAGEEL